MVSGARRPLYSLPTGGGKTVFACEIIRRALAKRRSALFIAHRRELIYQGHQRLGQHGIQAGVIMGRDPLTDMSLPVQVGSVQTLARRKQLPPADLIIVDEAHRTLGQSYLDLLDRYPRARVVGLSATPYRTDGRGLGEVYDALVEGPSIAELVEQGYLVTPRIYSPPMSAMEGARSRAGDYRSEDLERVATRDLVGDLVDHWMQLARGRPTVAFAVSVAHSQMIAESFRRVGVRAEHLDGATPHHERAEMLRRLASGEIEIVSNCAVLTEGWDSPAVSAAIVARPTLSRGLWRQMAGRILRTAPGKSDAILLDHGGCARLHGHILDPDPVSLDGVGAAKRAEEAEDYPTRVCPECYMVAPGKPPVCPYCGATMTRQARPPPEPKAGRLEEVKPGRDVPLLPDASTERIRRKAIEWLEIARTRGHKPGSVLGKLTSTFASFRTDPKSLAEKARAYEVFQEVVDEQVSYAMARGAREDVGELAVQVFGPAADHKATTRVAESIRRMGLRRADE